MNLMNKIALSAVALAFLSSCAPSVTTSASTSSQTRATYTGPKARLTVSRFECKADRCYTGIASDLSDSLVTALMDSNRFDVLETASNIGDLSTELNISGQKDNFQGADLVVTGAITAFEPDSGGINADGLAIPVPIFGSVDLGTKDAYIALDIRLIDVKTRRIVTSRKIEGRASSFKGGVNLYGRDWGGSLSGYKNTPMEKAVAMMLDTASDVLSTSIPASYYKY